MLQAVGLFVAVLVNGREHKMKKIFLIVLIILLFVSPAFGFSFGIFDSDDEDKLDKITVDGAEEGQALIFDSEGNAAPQTISGDGSGDMGAWGASSEVTLVSGVAALSGEGYYTIDTESDDATDDLTQITGLADGDEVVIAAEHNDRTVTVKAGTYFYIVADFTLNNTRDRMTLQCIGSNICVEKSGRVNGGD